MPSSPIGPVERVPQAGILPRPGSAPPHEGSGVFFGAEGLRAGWGIAVFILFLGFGLALQVALLKWLRALPPAGSHLVSPRMTLLNETVPLLTVLFATAFLARVEHRPFEVYGLGGRRKVVHVLAGLGWGVTCLSILVLLLAAGGYLHFDGRLLSTPAALGYGILWGGCFLLVALFEETLLRGYLQFTLARGLSAVYRSISKTPHSEALGFWTAALLLSFLFGASHHANAGESPIGMLAAGLAGLVFCFSLWRTGSLWWAIGFHAAWDWAQSFLYGVADSGIVSAGRLFATHPVGQPILSGGVTGPEGSVFALLVLTLVAAIIRSTLPPMPRPDPLDIPETTPALN